MVKHSAIFASVPNNNPNQYHTTIRWAANHPWIQVSNLRDLLVMAVANPAAFVIDHGTSYSLPLESYEWLLHASEDSYDNWYYDQSAGVTGKTWRRLCRMAERP